MNTWWTILAAVTVTAGTARFEVLSDQLHHYYRKRLLGAFYHRSEDLSLREVDCTRSPFLLCNTVMNDEELIKFVMNINRALHHHLGFAQARAADRLHRVPIYLQWCRLDADFTQPVNVEIRVVDDNRVRCFRQAREGGEGTTYTIQLPAAPGHPGHMGDAYDAHVHYIRA